jgi:hypothetical protein
LIKVSGIKAAPSIASSREPHSLGASVRLIKWTKDAVSRFVLSLLLTNHACIDNVDTRHAVDGKLQQPIVFGQRKVVADK